MTLPKDLKVYCRKRVLIRVIPCVALTAFLATILILWGDIIFRTDSQPFKMSCYMLVMALPFAMTGVPYKLMDRTYYGTVRHVDIVTTLDNESSVKPTREHIYFKNTVYLTIETPGGKLIERKAHAGRAGTKKNFNPYHEGDSVFHLYGTNTVIVLPKTNDRIVECSVCGSSNNIENTECNNCGHTLIKSIDMN